MSIFEIGRVFDGIDVDVTSTYSSGDQLSVSGDLLLGAVSAANRPGVGAAVRDRLMSLTANKDEMVVPVTWSEDPTVDGFYEPLSVSFSPSSLFAVEGTGSWQIELRRFGGGSLPQVEVYGTHTARSNSHSITTTTLNGSNDYRRICVPAAAIDYWHGSQATAETRSTASGDLYCWYFGNTPISVASTFTVAPADYYDGACEIRTTYGAAASQLVLGRYAPRLFDGMTLSNGLVRVFLHPSIDTAFEVEVFDGSDWENLISGTGWRIEHDYGGGSTQQWDLSIAQVQILRNSPERCTIRLLVSVGTAQFGRVWIDLTVRRGDPFVLGTVRSDTMGSLGGVVALEPTTSTISTALTGAIRASTTDLPEANRALWGIANGSPSNNLTTGRIVQTSGQTVTPFMVGVEFGGSSSSGIEDDQDVVYQWYDTKSERQRLVLR